MTGVKRPWIMRVKKKLQQNKNMIWQKRETIVELVHTLQNPYTAHVRTLTNWLTLIIRKKHQEEPAVPAISKNIAQVIAEYALHDKK